MNRSFIFSASLGCEKLKSPVDVCCVFLEDRQPWTKSDFFGVLDRALASGKTLPDCLLVCAKESLVATLYGYWENSPEQEGFVRRGWVRGRAFVKECHFYCWDAEVGLIRRVDSAPGMFQLNARKVIRAGLNTLVQRNPVVQRAPPGHAFRHPSGRISKTFCQARELSTSEAELIFCGRSLPLAVSMSVLKKAKRVLIDSMGIYSIVRECLQFYGSPACIDGFHSYDDLKSLRLPRAEHMVVISASTSGSMAKDLSEKLHARSEGIVTLVDVEREGRPGDVLVTLSEALPGQTFTRHAPSDVHIEIVGEHFSAKARPPRAVTLGLAHLPDALPDIARRFGRGMLLRPLQPFGSGRAHPLWLNSTTVSSDEDFGQWLKNELEWHIPPATDLVICTHDAGSIDLGQRILRNIQQLRGSRRPPKLVSYCNPGDLLNIRCRSLIVVTALCGNGGILRRISRELREVIKGADVPRRYVIGLALPGSTESWRRLEKFLERGKTERKYGVSRWKVLPIGDRDSTNAWDDIVALAQRATYLLEVVPFSAPLLSESLSLFASAVQKSAAGFLPRSDSGPLQLTDGFVYLADAFPDASKTPVAVLYLAWLAALAAAREHKDLAHSLASSGYESVVIDPENFSRFNDGILQAALLRSARASEMDYAGHPELSSTMKEFLLKVFDRHQTDLGAAALEFAAALASNRLRLRSSDHEEIISFASKRLQHASSALRGCIWLMSREAERAEQLGDAARPAETSVSDDSNPNRPVRLAPRPARAPKRRR